MVVVVRRKRKTDHQKIILNYTFINGFTGITVKIKTTLVCSLEHTETYKTGDLRCFQ